MTDVGNEIDHSSRAICAGSSVSSPTNPETDTPSSLTAFFIEKSALNNSDVTFAKSLRRSTEPAIVRLREINSKSANLTLSVTVRPCVPLCFSPDLKERRHEQIGQYWNAQCAGLALPNQFLELLHVPAAVRDEVVGSRVYFFTIFRF
jgi:hypothetical protein